MLTFNEGKVCDAIVRHLEVREGAIRADVQWPEAVHHVDPVELTWKLGDQLFALEHTGIEPFDDHMRLEAAAKQHFDPVREALKDVLPDEIIELHVPAKAMLGLKKAQVAMIQAAIIAWVRQTAPTLRTRSYADYVGDVLWAKVEGVPFEIRLFRFENLTRQKGWVQIVHCVVGDREQQRRDRLQRACDNKFPKLAAWRQKRGARTILVLEENDIQLTNYAIVARTYLPLALGRIDRPDETYLVSSCVEPWNVWPILIGVRTLYDLATDDYVQRWEVSPMTLMSMTRRQHGRFGSHPLRPAGHGRADPRESRWIDPTRRAAFPAAGRRPMPACKRAPHRPSLNR